MSALKQWSAPTGARLVIFASSWVGYVGFYLCRRNFSVVMPLLGKDQHFSNMDFANAIFAFSAAYTAGQIALGALADRLGSRRVVALGMFVSAAANWGIGASSRAGTLVALQTLNGFAQAAGWPGLGRLVGSWFPRAGRGITMAWWSTNYVVGGFLGGVLASYAITSKWFPSLGWRRGAVLPAVVLALLAFVFYGLARDRQPSSGAANPAASKPHGPSGNPMLRVLASAYFCIKLIRYSLFFWLPLYLGRAADAPARQAGYVSSLFELAGVAGVLATGYLSENIFESRRFPPAAAMLLCLAGACAVAGMLTNSGIVAVAISIALLGFFTYGPDALLVGAAAQDAAAASRMGFTLGAVDGLGSLGQMASPYVVSIIVGAFGWRWMFMVLALLACFSAVILRIGFRAERLHAAVTLGELREV